MKKFNFLVICLLFSICSIAQQMPIGTTADVTLPKNAERIDRQSMISRSKKLFRNSEMEHLSKTENLYKIDDMSLNLWDNRISKTDERTLEDIKQQALGIYQYDKAITVDSSEIKSVRNNQFLIIRYRKGEANYIRFMSNPKNGKCINGLMEFKKEDQEKAEAKIDEILKHIFFR